MISMKCDLKIVDEIFPELRATVRTRVFFGQEGGHMTINILQ